MSNLKSVPADADPSMVAAKVGEIRKDTAAFDVCLARALDARSEASALSVLERAREKLRQARILVESVCDGTHRKLGDENGHMKLDHPAIEFLRTRLPDINGAKWLILRQSLEGIHAYVIVLDAKAKRSAIEVERDLYALFPDAHVEITAYLMKDLGPSPEDALVGAPAWFDLAASHENV